jgi:hypothetical protein
MNSAYRKHFKKNKKNIMKNIKGKKNDKKTMNKKKKYE